jgi:hypothetical protein
MATVSMIRWVKKPTWVVRNAVTPHENHYMFSLEIGDGLIIHDDWLAAISPGL